MAICGVDDTPVANAADDRIILGFADERSVVQTRFATGALALLRAGLGEDLEPAAPDGERALAADLPIDVGAFDHFVFLGRGWTVGLANEAALKMREASGAWAESYPAMEYRHGPISVAGTALGGLAARRRRAAISCRTSPRPARRSSITAWVRSTPWPSSSWCSGQRWRSPRREGWIRIVRGT